MSDAPRRPSAALDALTKAAGEIYDAIRRGELPELSIPSRGLDNVRYDPDRGYFEIGAKHKIRALGVRTAKAFAQTLRMMALSKQIVESGDFATKREAYYVSKNWGACRFDGQPESDATMDDIEALAATEGVYREQLGFFPEEHGGSVAGELSVFDRNPATGRITEIDCTRLGTGAYTVPHSVEHLRLETDARFVLAIETGGMFQRLNGHELWRREHCILVELAGVPSRATRRFVRRLSDEKRLPVYCFADCDPYGFANIYRTLKVGSGNSAHVSRFFSVPNSHYLGVTPQDIVDFRLSDATHPLSASDRKRAEDALRHDPFFASEPRWIAAIEQMLEMGVRAEQQALAKWGLNYVIDEYLPRKLADPSAFLP